MKQHPSEPSILLGISAMAAASGYCEAVVRRAADAGLIASYRTPHGFRLFRPEAAEQLRAIKKQKAKARRRQARAVN
jgi:hypothetical protein